MDQKTADKLREKHPNHIPLKEAGEILGVSPRQLSELIAAGREPYASIGGNIGTKQRYIRIYIITSNLHGGDMVCNPPLF